MSPRWLLAVAASLAALPSAPAAESLGFIVPDGFEVSLYADDSLATDIFSLTVDAEGRVVVAGRGYVKVLHDTKGTGKADKATLFADVPKSGARGMYFDGDDLICTGDGGILRIRSGGEGKPAQVTKLFAANSNNEHAANGIVRGPDGWYYVICGNSAGIGPEHAKSPGSLVKNPNSGALVRFSPDGKTVEVIADGFRNPYDLDFNHLGSILTVDSDGERIYRLPWYTPCRLFDIAPGMHHGWLQGGSTRSWARPAYFPDNVERLVEIGRGSPTGVLCYRHHAFPERYRNGVFNLCWTFGRLYFFPLTRKGASYESKLEIFLQSKGEEGFAPVDMAVGPDGDLFIAIGGRGTRGSVYRVHYKGELPKREEVKDPVRAALRAEQPLSSWSRAKWVPEAKKLRKQAFEQAILDKKLPLEERIRAVEVHQEIFGPLDLSTAQSLLEAEAEPELLARSIWSIAQARTVESCGGCARATARAKDDPWVARAAWEGLAIQPADAWTKETHPYWDAVFDSRERRIRALARFIGRTTGRDSVDAAIKAAINTGARIGVYSFWGDGEPSETLHWAPGAFQKGGTVAGRMELLRRVQLALGDVMMPGPNDGERSSLYVGYAARSPEKVSEPLRQQAAQRIVDGFPTGDLSLDLEAHRTLGMLQSDVPGLLDMLAARWTADSPFSDDVHYLIVYSRIPTKRRPVLTRKTATAVNRLIIKLAADGARPGDQMPSVLEELWDELVKRDPDLTAALVADPAFGVPGHELFAARMPAELQALAARKLLASIKKLDEDRAAAAWSPELVRLVATLPDAEALPVLREQASDPRLADSIALILAGKRLAADRSRLVEALGSTQEKVVTTVAEALLAMSTADVKATPAEIGSALKSLRRFSTGKEAAPRKPLIALVQRWSGQEFAAADKPDAVYAASFAWYSKTYPKEAAALTGMAGADAAAWSKRFAVVDWNGGDIKRGERVFQAKCFRCHGATGRLGPDLTGVGQRFSRDDLFTAIIEPSKDILPAFQPTRIVTKSGKTYNGLLVYQSAEATLLQTTPDTTVRIGKGELLLLEPGKISFMPTGLLDDAKDADLADLYAYLKSLRKQ
jgi:putative membrane-bound dehydrogenase-like protein